MGSFSRETEEPAAPVGDDVTPDKGQEPPVDTAKLLQEFKESSAADRAILQQTLQKLAPKQEGYDPVKFWAVPKDASAAEKAQIWERQLREFTNGAVGQRIQNLEAQLAIAQAKSKNPEFDKYRDEAFKLVQSGKVADLDTAIELTKLRRGGAAPKRGKGRATQVPVPPATAASPSTTAASDGQKKYRNFGDIRKDADVQKAMHDLRMAGRS
jgi:hypothetical protein